MEKEIKASDRELLRMRIGNSILTVIPSYRVVDGKEVIDAYTLMNETTGMYHRWYVEEEVKIGELFQMARTIA